jgi:hypothetical protein
LLNDSHYDHLAPGVKWHCPLGIGVQVTVLLLAGQQSQLVS